MLSLIKDTISRMRIIQRQMNFQMVTLKCNLYTNSSHLCHAKSISLIKMFLRFEVVAAGTSLSVPGTIP